MRKAKGVTELSFTKGKELRPFEALRLLYQSEARFYMLAL